MMDPAKGTSKGEPQPPLHDAGFSVFGDDEVLHLFLLAGQSNMKGRATIPLTPKENSNILFFHSKQLQWYVARDPLHAQGVPDLIDGNDNSGTGPGMSFARCLADARPGMKIGLIPAAVGGAPIGPYGPGGKLYERSLMLAQEATKASPLPVKLRAILWLQGESDSTEERCGEYEVKLMDLVDRYREDFDDPRLPFIGCTIGSFVNKGIFLCGREINEALLSLPQKRDHTTCIDATDLTGHIGDEMHYDLVSQVEIGKRFADAYLGMMKDDS